MDKGYKYITIDGNNRTRCVTDFFFGIFQGLFPLFVGEYEIGGTINMPILLEVTKDSKYFEDLDPRFRNLIENIDITVKIVESGTREDLADLFLAAYETANASGRYFGVYKSLHWQDIYAECKKLLPKMKMPSPLVDLAIQPTLFDFTRRDHLGVTVRDFPTLLRDTIEWIQSDPFAEGKNDVGTF